MKFGLFFIVSVLFQLTINGQTVNLTVNDVPNGDIVSFVNLHSEYDDFILSSGTYNTGGNNCIERNKITIRAARGANVSFNKGNNIASIVKLCGGNIVLDGLTWDGRESGRRTDLATVVVASDNNIIKNCSFRNFDEGESIIIRLGKLAEDTFTTANNTVIEKCVFENWAGTNGGYAGCIVIGDITSDLNFSNIIVRNNQFISGPFKKLGSNSVIKMFKPSSHILIENNYFSDLHAVLETKTSNVTVRGNRIINASGYNVLANRGGNNNLFEGNYVENVFPIEGVTRAQAMMIWNGSNIVYRNNIFYHCKDMGLFIGKQSPDHTNSNHWLITNNTFVDWERLLFEYVQPSGVSVNDGLPNNVYLINNILYNTDENTSSYNEMIGINSFTSNFISNSLKIESNNLFHNLYKLGESTLSIEDPYFVDLSNKDFRISSNSPAIDNTFNLATMPFLDYDNVIRPRDGNEDGVVDYDIGAYEYINPEASIFNCTMEDYIILSNQTLTDNYFDYFSISVNNSTIPSNSSINMEYLYEVNINSDFDVINGGELDISRSKCTHIAPINFQNRSINSESLTTDDTQKRRVALDIDNSIVLYPNPNQGSFKLGIVGASIVPEKIEIFDSTGKQIFNETYNNSNILIKEINISKTGVYFVKIKTTEGFVGKKIIVR